jgi:hypothetical protein
MDLFMSIDITNTFKVLKDLNHLIKWEHTHGIIWGAFCQGVNQYNLV